MIIGLIFSIALIPVVVDTVQNTNTTGWTFTGYAGAISIFLMLPFIFIGSILVWFVGKLFGKW